MGHCASKSQFDREVEEVRRERPDAAATVYSSQRGTPMKDLGLVNGKYSKHSIPAEPETPQRDTIPARPGTPSVSEYFQEPLRPSPLPTSKVSLFRDNAPLYHLPSSQSGITLDHFSQRKIIPTCTHIIMGLLLALEHLSY